MKTTTKRNRWGRLWLVCVWLLSVGPRGGGQPPPGSATAPINPELLRYLAASPASGVALRAEPGRPLGYVPPPIDLSHLKRGVPRRTGTLPSSYDLRTLGRVTPVKNQNPYGTCWAHGVMASLESCLLPGETWDFSENNLANRHGFDYGYDDGGSAWFGLAYFARWDGPVAEADDPYPNPGGSPPNVPLRKHVQAVRLFWPDRGEAGYDTLKSVIMEKGALSTAMYWTDDAYNWTNGSFCYTGTNDANHVVAIVGWDDTYGRTKFKTPATRDGAFIVKNSWGTNFADGGYFYASYDDTLLGDCGNLQFFNAEAVTNYDSVYQHDRLGWVSNLTMGDHTGWAVNLFAATSACRIAAVSFVAPANGASWELAVHGHVTETNPAGGARLWSTSGSQAYAGYYTVPVTPSVSVPAGGRFAVVLKITTPDYDYPIPVECVISNYSSRAVHDYGAGRSFASLHGDSWWDMGCAAEAYILCVKAFTRALPARTVAGDYDGDGLADLLVQGSGAWRVGAAFSGYQPESFSLGGSGGQAVCADYDGDRLADPAVYFPNAGLLYCALSSLGRQVVSVGIGGSGWICVPGDFDGDGRADPAVYRASDGAWACLRSGCGYTPTVTVLGGNGGSAVAGDFDGDGKADPAVFQSATATFTAWLSGSGYGRVETSLGMGGTRAVCADYDGDGRTDPGIYLTATGGWRVLCSSLGYRPVDLSLGGNESVPVPADYDGDGLADPAIYVAATGLWQLLLSAGGYAAAIESLGSPGFDPVGPP